MQHPTPPQIDYEAALLAIDPDKDVDGLHPVNLGRLAMSMPGPVPCTPAGIEALLAYYEIPVAGHEVCILGRGFTLGRPLALLLSQKRPTANAAVTVVHTGVARLAARTRSGPTSSSRPPASRASSSPSTSRRARSWSAAASATRAAGSLPDVDERCEEVAGSITPRVGGVGPTTIAMLFRNTVEAAERRVGAAAVTRRARSPAAAAARGRVPARCGAAGPRRRPMPRANRRGMHARRHRRPPGRCSSVARSGCGRCGVSWLIYLVVLAVVATVHD